MGRWDKWDAGTAGQPQLYNMESPKSMLAPHKLLEGPPPPPPALMARFALGLSFSPILQQIMR